MCEQMVVEYCSPTLAGLKTGSLFSFRYEGRECLLRELREINNKLRGKGVIVIPVRIKEHIALIYVYRPDRLRRDLENEEVGALLKAYGYNTRSEGDCILHLIRRLKKEQFPHEIGLFLGYPPEDVKGFIENGAEGEKYIGIWKVYGDVEHSIRLFEKYKKCTMVYRNMYQHGMSIERLAMKAL